MNEELTNKSNKVVSHLADGHGDGGTLVSFVVFIVADEEEQIVDDADRRGLGSGRSVAVLDDDRRRRRRRQLEAERRCSRSQFLHQTHLFDSLTYKVFNSLKIIINH